MVGNRGESSELPFKRRSSYVWGQVWKINPPPPQPPLSLLTGTAAYGGKHEKVSFPLPSPPRPRPSAFKNLNFGDPDSAAPTFRPYLLCPFLVDTC